MGLTGREHKAVMGTVGPMGHRGPALGMRLAVQVVSAVQHRPDAGRKCWTVQVIDFACDFDIRPARPPNPRTHAHVRVCGRRCAGGGGRAYVRATRFHWTSGRMEKK